MYWVPPGSVFTSKASLAFAGVHSMQHQVYCFPGEAALAIFVEEQPQREMSIEFTGLEAVRSLEMTKRCIGTIRVVTCKAEMYVYYGDWMIASIKRVSDDQAVFDLLGVFTASA